MQPPPSSVMHIRGCNICGGAHESGSCMVQDDEVKKFNYMSSQNYHGFHQEGSLGFHQRGNFSQGHGWRSHLGNNVNQGGLFHQPPNPEPNIYEKTTKLEETLV